MKVEMENLMPTYGKWTALTVYSSFMFLQSLKMLLNYKSHSPIHSHIYTHIRHLKPRYLLEDLKY